jgi:hypothetical protein
MRPRHQFNLTGLPSVLDLFSEPAWWGAAGAFVYGAPRLHSCLISPKPGETTPSCVFEFVVALIVGAIGAAALAPWVVAWRHMTEPRDLNAVASLIGLLANPTAPTLITFAPRLASTIFAAMKGKPDGS